MFTWGMMVMAFANGAAIMVVVGAILKGISDGEYKLAGLYSILILCSLAMFALFLVFYNPVAGGGGI